MNANVHGNTPALLRNHSVDSTRWESFEFRPGDVVIGSWARSGTTWVQQIVAQLVFKGDPHVATIRISPWIEHRAWPARVLYRGLNAQKHQRFVKTHLPMDSLPYSADARYLYVARDGRETAYSWFEHHQRLGPEVYATMSSFPESWGEPLKPPSRSFREYFHAWLDRDGYPLWPYWSNVQSFWNVRDKSNVLLVHYDDLKSDLGRMVRQIGEFIGTPVERSVLPQILEHCSLPYMKDQYARQFPELSRSYVNGQNALLNRGESRRWAEHLDDEDVAKYNAVMAGNLTPDCAQWLTSAITGRV